MFANELTITVENLRGIKHLEFQAPTRHGVYVLSGVNGCGKTTLLTALARISDPNAFNSYLVSTPFDDFSKSKISYRIVKNGHEYNGSFKRAKKYWNPEQKKFNLSAVSPFSSVTFISTAHQRFIESSILDNLIVKTDARSVLAPNDIREGMARILSNDEFKKLRYQTIKNKGAAVKNPRRDNKVYYIPLEGGHSYSEIHFSFGEKMVLNALEILTKAKEKSMLLIDEIELALHPTAQIEFYNYLKENAKSKKLLVILSSHSASLIKAAEKRIYLDHDRDNEGCIIAKMDCYPAYILKDVSFTDDLSPDFLFFVEDIQAKRLLEAIIYEMKSRENYIDNLIYRICPVAGWEETIRLMAYFKSIPPYSNKNVEAFPDKDAEETIQSIIDKPEDKRTDSDQRRLKLWRDNQENILTLHITPELGVWTWLSSVPDAQTQLQNMLEHQFGNQVFNISQLVGMVAATQPTGKNLREQAKYRLMDVAKAIQLHLPELSYDTYYKLLYKSYVVCNYEEIKSYYKEKFCLILHR